MHVSNGGNLIPDIVSMEGAPKTEEDGMKCVLCIWDDGNTTFKYLFVGADGQLHQR